MAPPDPLDPRKSRCADHAEGDECLSPPPPSLSASNGHGRRFVPFVVTASVLVFLALVSLSVYCFIRRRRRRRQQSLLAAEATDPGVEGGGPALPAAAAGGAEEEVVHHAWHIRTVGLDEAAIESIALTRYRAGAGMLGAADCSVCLGEYRDGELLRLLPNCGHAFHVPCIDTWLRAHVNCPLCRAHVLDHAAADPPVGASAGTPAAQAPNATDTSQLEQPAPDQLPRERGDLRVQIDHRDNSSSPEPPPLHRRVASMDLSLVPAGDALEDEQELNDKAKQGNGGAAAARRKASSRSGRLHHMESSLSGGGDGRLSLASPRHCRTRSSVLPL